MNQRYIPAILVASVLMFGLIACGTQPTSENPVPKPSTVAGRTTNTSVTVPTAIVLNDTPTPTTPQKSGNLIQALSVMPVSAHHVVFTNWALIKEYEGARDFTSASNWDKRIEFFRAVSQRHAAPSAYGVRSLEEHAKAWAWDTTDLEWEAGVSISLPPGYVLKFRSDFNLAPVIAHFEERGFAKSVYHGVTIYTHTLDLELDWLRLTEFSILNTAILTDANMLMMSISLDGVHDMLDTYQNRASSLADDPAVQATVSGLGEVAAAFISADACSAFSSKALLETPMLRISSTFEQLKSQLKNRPQLQNYEALGVGYRYEGAQPIGLIVMHFSTADQARTDLQPRRQLAMEGLVRGPKPQAYSDTYFTLVNASVKGNEIMLEVRPVNDKPARLFMMTSQTDMTFATCP